MISSIAALLVIVFLLIGIMAQSDKMNKVSLYGFIIFFAIWGIAIAAEAQELGVEYVCSTETTDVFDIGVEDGMVYTLAAQSSDVQIYVEQSGRYYMPRGGVYLWLGMANVGLLNYREIPCENASPYVEPLVECLGFYAPVDSYTVDGTVYNAGEDGWVSFQVPRDAVWTWEVVVGDWEAAYTQTDVEGCHYEG